MGYLFCQSFHQDFIQTRRNQLHFCFGFRFRFYSDLEKAFPGFGFGRRFHFRFRFSAPHRPEEEVEHPGGEADPAGDRAADDAQQVDPRRQGPEDHGTQENRGGCRYPGSLKVMTLCC